MKRANVVWLTRTNPPIQEPPDDRKSRRHHNVNIPTVQTHMIPLFYV